MANSGSNGASPSQPLPRTDTSQTSTPRQSPPNTAPGRSRVYNLAPPPPLPSVAHEEQETRFRQEQKGG